MKTKDRHRTCELLDDDVTRYTLADWRARNIELYAILSECCVVDPAVVSASVVQFLGNRLLNPRVGAALDLQNAGHIRAQNENVVYFGLFSGVDRQARTVAFVAGLIHDLNKAFREVLRTDAFAVTDSGGNVVREMTTEARIVGLNHLGDRTRRALEDATKLAHAPLDPEVAHQIDQCIVHHGLGSSRFVRDLVAGINPWWGHEFVDPKTSQRLLHHPPPPPLSLASILHDLADSTQQMQAGLAWLMKYPTGYWSTSGRSFREMLSGGSADDGPIPLSLRCQIEVELETSSAIVQKGREQSLLSDTEAERLLEALRLTVESSRRWIRTPDGSDTSPTIYTEVAQILGLSIEEAFERMTHMEPGAARSVELERAIWLAARKLDAERAKDLADLIHAV